MAGAQKVFLRIVGLIGDSGDPDEMPDRVNVSGRGRLIPTIAAGAGDVAQGPDSLHEIRLIEPVPFEIIDGMLTYDAKPYVWLPVPTGEWMWRITFDQVRVGEHLRELRDFLFPLDPATDAQVADEGYPGINLAQYGIGAWEPGTVNLTAQAISQITIYLGRASNAAGDAEQAVQDTIAAGAAAESRISIEHEHVHQDVQHVDQVAAQAAALLDQANVFAQDQVPPYLQQEVLNATYATKADLDTKADATELEPLIALSEIMPTIQQTRVGSVAARNVGLGDRLPRHVPFIQADPANETSTNYAGMTITHHADSPWGQGIPAWSGETSGAGSARINIGLSAPPNLAGHTPSVVGVEVWVEDPSKIIDIQILLRGGAGVWSRVANQSGSSHVSGVGVPLVKGPNIIRIAASASLPANIPGSTSCEVRFNTNGATRGWVRRTWVETPQKARLGFIVDWGAKSGYEAWKRDLRPLGVPMTAALRVGRLGTGTPPNDHMTVADVKEMMAFGGNSVSIHSFDGQATSTMTPEQVREDFIKSIAEMQRLGIYTDGALHRAAWTQNLAPNAPAINDLLVTGRTYSDSTTVTSWPPTLPLNMPARRIGEQASVDAKFEEMKSTNSMWLGFIHGVTPTGDANHISQANWDYFVSKLASEMAAGTVECVTVEQLARTERLFHLPHLGL